MKRLWFLSMSAVFLTTGCATIEDFNYRNVNRARACSAWKSTRACLPKQCVNHDYESGFKEGYFAVATGSGSCPPVVPPPRYFHAKYQSCEGQTHVNQWYQGYQAGTIAADRHGRSLWADVPTQDGPGCACAPSVMTTDSFHTDVISVPTENVQVQPQ